MTIRYAVAENGKLRLTVNGVDYSYLNTLSTDNWSVFTLETELTIPLQPGPANVIRLAGGNGGVNVDYLTVAGLPVSPQVRLDATFGVRANRFGFNIAGDNWFVAVDSCTNLANPVWSPAATGTLTGNLWYFSAPDWTNYPARFYRLRSP